MKKTVRIRAKQAIMSQAKTAFECLLFDFDGTLADSLQVWLIAWQKTFGEFGVKMSQNQVVEKAFTDWHVIEKMGIEDVDGFIEKLYAKVDRGFVDLKLDKKTVEVVKKLDKKVKLGVATSSRTKVIKPVLEKCGVLDCFEVILGEEDIKYFKPNPEIVDLALEKLECKKDGLLFCGDSINDIKAGKAAGVKTAWFFPEKNHRFHQSEKVLKLQPDYLISNLYELLEIVD